MVVVTFPGLSALRDGKTVGTAGARASTSPLAVPSLLIVDAADGVNRP